MNPIDPLDRSVPLKMLVLAFLNSVKTSRALVANLLLPSNVVFRQFDGLNFLLEFEYPAQLYKFSTARQKVSASVSGVKM